MRFIDINGKIPPEKWSKKAEKHTHVLQLLDNDEDRMTYINSHSYIWRELRGWLEELSHKKCWYSESISTFSYLQVEHFRPKGKVIRFNDGAKEIGYWWLAFDWRNYRLCGEVGNLRKATHFPLKEGSSVAINPDCDLRDEVICLLDPTNPNDPPLLKFEESGYVSPAKPKGTWEYERAMKTIDIFYLNFHGLTDARLDTWRNCFEVIGTVENLLSKPPSEIDKTSIIAAMNKLKNMTSEKAQFSATSRACLLSSGRLWARILIN